MLSAAEASESIYMRERVKQEHWAITKLLDSFQSKLANARDRSIGIEANHINFLLNASLQLLINRLEMNSNDQMIKVKRSFVKKNVESEQDVTLHISSR